jgi:DNA-binding MarR family transcriptional regulator
MSSGGSRRDQLQAALEQTIRRTGANSVIVSQTIADRLGINPTDLECCDLLFMNGPLTAGKLAELTGLTTGAITGVIDRLERAGLVERQRDPRDRRKVIVRLLVESERVRRIGALYEPLSRAMDEILARYSDDELALIVDFTTRTAAVVPAVIPQMEAAAARWPQEDDEARR